MDIFIGIVLIVSAVFLVVAVLLQSGKDKSLSGTISGSSSDTYYGKNKGSSKDRILNKLTTVVAVVFALLVVISFVIQDDGEMKLDYDEFVNNMTATDSAEDDEDGVSSSDSSSDSGDDPADTGN